MEFTLFQKDSKCSNAVRDLKGQTREIEIYSLSKIFPVLWCCQGKSGCNGVCLVFVPGILYMYTVASALSATGLVLKQRFGLIFETVQGPSHFVT